MRRLLTPSIVCLGISATWACGSTTSGSGQPGGKADPGAIHELVDSFCQTVRSCCQAGGFPLEPIANCESEFPAQSELLPYLDNGTVVIHAEPFATCVNSFRSAASTCAGGQVAPACADAFGGTIPEGAACEKSDQCLDTKDPAICLKVRPAGVVETPTTGICKLAPRGRAGDPCFTSCSTGRSCGSTYSTDNPNPVLTLCYEEDGLFCSSSGTERRCAPLAAAGGPCTSFDSCASNLYCSKTSVCTARSNAGVVCAASGECAPGLSCVSGSCAPIPVANPKTCSGDYN
jgi:hypothetical protein